MSASIPILSLPDLSSNDAEVRRAAEQELLRGFGEFGLVFLADTGFDHARLKALYAGFLAFSNRSDADKRALARADLWYQRGWTPPNTEVATASTGQPDYKECYFAACLPSDPLAARMYPELYAENVWPQGDERFPTAYEGVARELQSIGEALLAACESALTLEAGRLVEGVRGGPHVTRLLRYLPVSQARLDEGVLWGENHTDFNTLTLLPGGQFLDPSGAPCPRPEEAEGSGGGLYLTLRQSEGEPLRRIAGRARAGCVIAQIGQQLEVLTGGRLLATPHEIEAPQTPGYSRLSCAHFVHLNPRETLFPLPPYDDAEALQAYRPPVLAGTYDLKTLVDIGLAPQQALDRLGYGNGERLKRDDG